MVSNSASFDSLTLVLLGYKVQGISVFQSTAVSKCCLNIKVKVLLHIEDHSKYFEENKDLIAILIKGLLCNIL